VSTLRRNHRGGTVHSLLADGRDQVCVHVSDVEIDAWPSSLDTVEMSALSEQPTAA
jgi:hypothetical protein